MCIENDRLRAGATYDLLSRFNGARISECGISKERGYESKNELSPLLSRKNMLLSDVWWTNFGAGEE